MSAKEIASVLKTVKEDQGTKRKVNIASLNFMVTMNLLHEYMLLIASIPEHIQVSEELLSEDNEDLVGEAIREFLVRRKDKDKTSRLDKEQLASNVIDAIRVTNEKGASSNKRQTKIPTKGRDVMTIVTAPGDMTLVELICHIFCWNVVRSAEKERGNPSELQDLFFGKDKRFKTTSDSVKTSSQLMKVLKIGNEMVTSKIESPSDFQMTGSLLSLTELGDLIRGSTQLEDKLIRKYTLPTKPAATKEDKPSNKKESKKRKSEKDQSKDKNGSTTDTEETNSKKQRTNDCASKTIVSQQSGNTTQHELHGRESKVELRARAVKAAQNKLGTDMLGVGLITNIASAIIDELFPTLQKAEADIDEMIENDDVVGGTETTFEAVEGYEVGKPYDKTGFFDVINNAWSNMKWRGKKHKHKTNKRIGLTKKEEQMAEKWAKKLFDSPLKEAFNQIVKEMNKSIVFLHRKDGEVYERRYNVSGKKRDTVVDPYNTIYIYGEPSEDRTKRTTNNANYRWMVPNETEE